METIRVDFENEQGAQYVEMRTFKSIPWALSKKLAVVGDIEKSDDAKMRAAEAVAIALVVSGEALSAWTGDPLVFPLTNETVGDAPAELLGAVLAKFSELRGSATDPQR